MPLLDTSPGDIVTNFPSHTVEVIDYLGDPGGWQVVPHLYCDSLQLAANAYDEASLAYEIGTAVVQPGTTSYAQYQPLDLRGKFVRITIDTAPTSVVWVGYVLDNQVVRGAVKQISGSNRLTGRTQLLAAVGLEWFLDRKQIASSVVRRVGASPDHLEVYRPLPFNGGPTDDLDPGSAPRGNRSANAGATDLVYDFADQSEPANLWSARQIIDHVLEHHTPKNTSPNPAPCLYAQHGSDAAFLDGWFPTLHAEGMTVFQILNRLCSPQRGLVWFTQYDETLFPKLFIRVQSMASASVALPGGGTLPANTAQYSLDFDTQVDVSRATLREIGSRDYHQVVVRGARMTSTCTVGVADGTLVPDWSQLTGTTDAGTEKKYKDASNADGDYSGLTDPEKRQRNDAYRRAEAFHRVYSCFRVPANWDGKTGDGGAAAHNWALPILSPTGSIVGGLPIHPAGLRMLNTLRLPRGWDYSTPSSPKSVTPDGSLEQLQAPFACLKVTTSPDRYQFVNKLRTGKFAVGSPVSALIDTSYHLYMQPGVPGLRLQSVGGLPHAIALNHWSPAEPSDTTPELDYSTLRATVCLEADAFAEGIYPETGLPANTPIQVLTIELGDTYRLDFLAANTIIDLVGGVPALASSAAVLRDDRPYLRDVARLAYEWYQLDRHALSLAFHQLRSFFSLGMLITTVGTGTTQQNVYTVVSSIRYDLKQGTATIETADDTLDVRALV